MVPDAVSRQALEEERGRLRQRLAEIDACLDVEGAPAGFSIDNVPESLQGIVDALPLPLYFKDREGRYRLVNRAFVQLFDREVGDVLGLRAWDLLPPELAERYADLDRCLWEKGGLQLSVGKLNSADDGREFQFHKALLTDSRNQPQALLGFIVDLTDQRRVEDALARSEARYQAMFAHAREAMVVLDDAGRFVESNAETARTIGYSHEELAELGLWTLLGLDRNEGKVLWEHFRAKDVPRGSARLQRKDGEVIEIEYSAVPRILPGQHLVMFHDVTPRKRAEREIEHGRHFIQAVADSSPCMIYVFDLWEGRNIWTNAAYREYMGRLVGKDDGEAPAGEDLAAFVHPEDRHRLLERGNELKHLPDGNWIECGLRLRDPDGGWRWFQDRTQVFLRDASGHILQMLSLVYDVNEFHLIMDDLIQAKEEAEAACTIKSLFLANISHEIRTPLNGLLGMLQLLETSPLDEEQQENVHLAIESGRGLLTVLNDILNLTRLESGKTQVQIAPFEPASLLDNLEVLFKDVAERKGIGLDLELDPELPRWLVGDGGRLRQVLFNLVGNGLKFSERGNVRVHLTGIQHPTASNQLILVASVADEGIGIAQSRLRDIFEPFSQVDDGTTRRYGGSGLGLSIVRRSVELMGGEVWVDSREGEGTEFVVHTPVWLPCAGVAETEAGLGHGSKASWSILLVEDDRLNRLALYRMLERSGHRVRTALDGAEALEELRRGSFDLVIMDVQMPHMDGIEATRRIRAGEAGQEHRDIPVIALTAHVLPDDRKRFMAAGMDAYLAKPVDLTSLLSELDRLIGR